MYKIQNNYRLKAYIPKILQNDPVDLPGEETNCNCFFLFQIIEGLQDRGHNLTKHSPEDFGPLSVIQLVTSNDVNIFAKSDRRKLGYGEAGF